MFKNGQKIKLKNGKNIYKVVYCDEYYYQVICIDFNTFEDIGDGICINSVEGSAWISKFFWYNFELEYGV